MGSFELLDCWGEFLALIFLILLIILSVSAKNFFLYISIIFLFGLLFGRFWFIQKKGLRFGLFLSTIGVVIGFFIGSFFAKTEISFVVFLVGAFLSYFVHKKKIISSVDY
jgi:uncharacterized membrane protein (DUF441 family)